MTLKRAIAGLASITCLILSGCASVDNVMRAQPSAGFSSDLVKNPNVPGSGDFPVEPPPPNGSYHMVVYAIGFDGKSIDPVPEEEGLGSEKFLTVDVSSVLKQGMGTVSPADERKIIRFLVYVSDHNATLWMNRIYALNKARHGLVGWMKDITTTGAGLSAFLSPPASASLGVASLLLQTTSNDIDEYVYSGKTVEVLFKGIQASRAVQLKIISDNLAKTDGSYDIYTALGDVKVYDSLTSFRKGLDYLSSLADATTDSAQNPAAPSKDGNKTPTVKAPMPSSP